MYIHNIRGFCNFDNIYEHYVSAAVGGETFVELGSLWGRSALKMASLIKDSNKDIKFYCIDFWDLRGISAGEWHLDDLTWVKSLGVNTDNNPDMCYEAFLKITFDMELQNHLFPIKLSSRVAHSLFKNESIDFLFIDADHTYEGVKEDISLWLPKVKPGGVIGGHDYDWSGVRLAVDETFKEETLVISDTSWLVQR
jgi:hypothetical protein